MCERERVLKVTRKSLLRSLPRRRQQNQIEKLWQALGLSERALEYFKTILIQRFRLIDNPSKSETSCSVLVDFSSCNIFSVFKVWISNTSSRPYEAQNLIKQKDENLKTIEKLLRLKNFSGIDKAKFSDSKRDSFPWESHKAMKFHFIDMNRKPYWKYLFSIRSSFSHTLSSSHMQMTRVVRFWLIKVSSFCLECAWKMMERNLHKLCKLTSAHNSIIVIANGWEPPKHITHT